MTKLEELKERLSRYCDNDSILAWSGGKDSMLILSVMKELGYTGPVLAFPYFWSNHQLEFIKKALVELSLEIVFYRPTSVQTSQEHIVAKYQLGGKPLPIIMDVLPGLTCGLDLVNKSLVGVVPHFHWKTLLVGSKKTDFHKKGDPLSFKGIEEVIAPLWEWTDEEVLETIKKEGYLYDTRVYDDEDITADTGNFVGCMNCFTNLHTYCPKVGTTIRGLYYG